MRWIGEREGCRRVVGEENECLKYRLGRWVNDQLVEEGWLQGQLRK